MRTASIGALFGLIGCVLGISVLGSIQAHAGNRVARQNYQTAGGGAIFTGGTVLDITTFQSTVTFDVQMEADSIRLKANRDLKCSSSSSCEIGSTSFPFLRFFVNQVDLNALRAKSSSTALDVAEPDGLIIAHEDSAAPTQPHACSVAGDFGLIQIVNDNDDATVSGVCYCGQLADDSTYDWLDITDNTACPFF